jgi:hypothetical protein
MSTGQKIPRAPIQTAKYAEYAKRSFQDSRVKIGNQQQ